MATPLDNRSEEILAFWFGTLDEQGRADSAHSERWFRKDPSFDETIRERFGAIHDAIGRGEHDRWPESPRGRLAWILVLDQFSRNMFRDTPKMFAYDQRAAAAALQGVEQADDRRLAHDERTFIYMPLMHSEDLAVQRRCLRLFTAWRDELGDPLGERVAGNLKYAEAHCDIIQRFGRFPHRNALLGRVSTPQEIEFLKQPGSSF